MNTLGVHGKGVNAVFFEIDDRLLPGVYFDIPLKIRSNINMPCFAFCEVLLEIKLPVQT